MNSFLVGFTWLLDISKSIPLSQISSASPRKKYTNETKQEGTEQARSKRPVLILDVIVVAGSVKVINLGM